MARATTIGLSGPPLAGAVDSFNAATRSGLSSDPLLAGATSGKGMPSGYMPTHSLLIRPRSNSIRPATLRVAHAAWHQQTSPPNHGVHVRDMGLLVRHDRSCSCDPLAGRAATSRSSRRSALPQWMPRHAARLWRPTSNSNAKHGRQASRSKPCARENDAGLPSA